MQGSLALHRGVVYVGRHVKTATVEAFDLGGRRLAEGFSFRDPRLGRSAAAGLAVDDERRVWVADTPASRVRTFTVFGREIGGLGAGLDERLSDAVTELDRPGRVRAPVDVAVRGDADGLRLVVASGGVRRNAVQVFDETGRTLAVLRSAGDPGGAFQGVRGVALHGRLILVAEGAARRIQVFREGDFHFHFTCGPRFEPAAVAVLQDGRVVVASTGDASSLLLFDAAGRLLRVLAEHGEDEGRVWEPSDIVLDEAERDELTRLVVIDRDGDRVQVFSLTGRCLGAFVAGLEPAAPPVKRPRGEKKGR